MKQYIADAFTNRVFSGNPAAVCVMEQWLPEETMLHIARENNLSETAFAVRKGEAYRLRWFTPGGEIDLCGHATLATAFILLNHYEPKAQMVSFDTASGRLTVTRAQERYEMDFPAYELNPIAITPDMIQALGATPAQAYLGRDLVCVFDDENTVRTLTPDMERLKQLPGLLQHVTAPGQEHDCVSRTFAPKLRVPEDPVCGSGHCHIAPYWLHRTGKETLLAYQASERGGVLHCRMEQGRMRLGGEAALYAVSELFI